MNQCCKENYRFLLDKINKMEVEKAKLNQIIREKEKDIKRLDENELLNEVKTLENLLEESITEEKTRLQKIKKSVNEFCNCLFMADGEALLVSFGLGFITCILMISFLSNIIKADLFNTETTAPVIQQAEEPKEEEVLEEVEIPQEEELIYSNKQTTTHHETENEENNDLIVIGILFYISFLIWIANFIIKYFLLYK